MIKDDLFVYAESINIKNENDLRSLKDKADWFYNVCEVLEYAGVVGKRLAEISRGTKTKFDNLNLAIEANSVLTVVLVFLDSFADLFDSDNTRKKTCLFYLCKYIKSPKKETKFRWQISMPFKGSPTFKLLRGLRHAVVHRHPINMRDVGFFGSDKRMGVGLYLFEFDSDIRLSPKKFENTLKNNQIKFVRKELFVSQSGIADKWFAWEEGKTLCFLDCEDLGDGISEFLFDLLLEVVKRNDNNIVGFLKLLREIGDRSILFPDNGVSYSCCRGFHVVEPVINRLECYLNKALTLYSQW